MNNANYWLGRTMDGFAARHPGRRHQLKLPSGISFTGSGDDACIVLSKDAVEDHNMQSDAAAFEAWALALHGYAGARTVSLDWRESK